MRILFLSASLASGGAERQIVALARGLRGAGHEVTAAVLRGGGPFEQELSRGGIAVHDLGRRGRWDLRFWPRLAALVRAGQPHVILAYLAGPNVYSASLKAIAPSVKVVWGIRSARREAERRAYDWLARIGPRIESAASHFADAVVTNSHAAARQAIANGIARGKIVVIPNGIDCARFRRDEEGARRRRSEWGIAQGAKLVGMVARLDPVKNHPAFLDAAARVVAAFPRDVRFVCVGRGAGPYRVRLDEQTRRLGLRDRLTWAGEETVTSALYSALDVAVLPSHSESFPNVVAEAMACGTPVVVTDTGDVSRIVGDAGVVVPLRDPVLLAEGIVRTLERAEEDRRALSERLRARIERNYSVDRLVTRTERLLRDVVSGA